MAGEPIERAEDRAARLAALAKRDAAHRARSFRVYLALLAVPVLVVAWILARGDAPTSAQELYDVVNRRIAQQQRAVDAQLQRSRSLSERQLQENHAYRASLDKDVAALERRIGEESRRRAAELATARQSSTSQLGGLSGMLAEVQ